MRYTVLTSRTFHNRITKYLGVLVAAALVATLGLPSAAQAQTPAPPTVEGTGDGTVAATAATITASWVGAAGIDEQNGWLVEYTEPGEPWADAIAVYVTGAGSDTLPTDDAIDANDPRIHHGVWKFRVSYWDTDAVDPDDEATDLDGEAIEGTRIGKPSALADYLHGPPASAPTGFIAYDADDVGPDARRLAWDKVTGADSYELRYSSDPDDDDEWEGWDPAKSGDVIDDLDMGVEYTFELRALGASRAGVGDLHGPSVSIMEMVPVPTPTLPEIAALFLAMLLLGSGAYLLRRRQSGGLTPA